MSEKFVASNKVPVSKDLHGCVTVSGLWSLREESQALREFFLHERDTELGVWRWVSSTGKDYLVRKLGYGEQFRVVREEHMEQLDWRPEEYNNGEMFRTTEMVKAIRAYLAAHPEPKPWHDAKPGEVWVLTYGGQPTAHVWTDRWAGPGNAFVSDRAIVGADDPDITSGHRIFPEVVSDDS